MNLEDGGKIVLDKTNPSNSIIFPSSPSPNPSNPIIHPISPQSNHDPKPSTSTIIIHPLYCPFTHTLAKDVIHWLLARNNTLPCHQTPILEPIKQSYTMPSPILTPSCDPQTINPITNPSQELLYLHVNNP